MAFTRFGFAGQVIPFWKRQIAPLPKWQKGDPQIRICLPTFWMKMIKPPPGTPNNQVYFVTHQQMTRHDIKNYLEKIYDVPVHSVRTRVKLTSNMRPGQSPSELLMMNKQPPFDPIRDKMKQSVKWAEEYKEAIVVLDKGATFEYPDIEGVAEEEDDIMKESVDKFQEEGKSENTGVPSWFA